MNSKQRVSEAEPETEDANATNRTAAHTVGLDRMVIHINGRIKNGLAVMFYIYRYVSRITVESNEWERM